MVKLRRTITLIEKGKKKGKLKYGTIGKFLESFMAYLKQLLKEEKKLFIHVELHKEEKGDAAYTAWVYVSEMKSLLGHKYPAKHAYIYYDFKLKADYSPLDRKVTCRWDDETFPLDIVDNVNKKLSENMNIRIKNI